MSLLLRSLKNNAFGELELDLYTRTRLGTKLLLEQYRDEVCRSLRALKQAKPPAGSAGPPYALVQFTLDDAPELKAHAHEGRAAVARGAVCLIGGASDLFISLAANGEHAGWESSMTVVGHVADEALRGVVEGEILAMPKHDFTHPQYGTVMSMLTEPVPCQLRAP